MIGSAWRPGPIFRTAHHIGVVDLQDLGRVLNDDAKGIKKIGEYVVPRAMAAYTPANGIAMIDHSPRAPHHRLQIGHHEGDVVQAVHSRIRQNDGVMIVIAAQESHRLGAIGQFESECLFEEATSSKRCRRSSD